MCTSPLFRITRAYIDKKSERCDTFFAKYTKELEVKRDYKPPYYRVEKIACGNCLECRMEYAKQWAVRCVKEAELYENNIMMTLTYNAENVPIKINKETGECNLSLKKKDHQDFMKRLRKAYPGTKIRFMLCGEYGEKFKRPHYHIICFNLKVEDLEKYKLKKCEWSSQQNWLYKSKKIEKIWGKGFVDLNEVNFETCRYVAGYVTKKLKGLGAITEYDNKGIERPYICMSRNPGLAEAYFQKNKEKFINGEKKIWTQTKKGLQEINPGRYFDKLIEKENPEALKKIKKQRLERSKEILKITLEQTSLNQDELREQKELINQQKFSKYKRTLE
ncbi:replication initiator protein [Peromfec virus RodF8_36]|uniref:Replication initiator protein n=1 Tax=Peromfec virus RodF8_36 TaxID=2929371 RepID=A0A976N100_9VIRU|nr:replication initiator protein [Peromfec virus RodF8_36]